MQIVAAQIEYSVFNGFNSIYVIDLDFSRTWNFHYENIPIQYTEIFKVVKNEKFSSEKFGYFSYFCSKHRL